MMAPTAAPLPDGPVPFPPAQRGLTTEMEAFSQKVATRNKRIGIAVGSLVVIAGVASAGWWWMNRPKPPPPELVAKANELLSTLEKDDAASLEAAKAGFAALQPTAPQGFNAALAGQLTALSLITADYRDQIQALQDKANKTDRERARIERDDKDKADWRARVGQQLDLLKKIKAELDPLVDQVTKLDEEQTALFAKAKEARSRDPEDLDITRALAVYYGVKGDPTGPKFAEHYRKSMPADGWASLVIAAYGAQARQTPDQLKTSLDSAKAAFSSDGRMLRAKRLEAKIELLTGDLAGASAAATVLHAANPADANTVRLQQQMADAETAKAPAPGH
jgi:hypothetical protein